jgi:hypothetical protein
MNFLDKLNDADTPWVVGSAIKSSNLPAEVYLVIKENTSGGAKYHMVKIDTMEVFLSSSSLTDLKTKFTQPPINKPILKVIEASNLTLVADEP